MATNGDVILHRHCRHIRIPGMHAVSRIVTATLTAIPGIVAIVDLYASPQLHGALFPALHHPHHLSGNDQITSSQTSMADNGMSLSDRCHLMLLHLHLRSTSETIPSTTRRLVIAMRHGW